MNGGRRDGDEDEGGLRVPARRDCEVSLEARRARSNVATHLVDPSRFEK